MTSRDSTTTVSHRGTCCMKASATNADMSSSLSAAGSRYAPSVDLVWGRRAMAPSSASVAPAATNTPSASGYLKSTRRIRNTGMASSRRSVRTFGMLRTSRTLRALADRVRELLVQAPGHLRRHERRDGHDAVAIVLLDDAPAATEPCHHVAAVRRQDAPHPREPGVEQVLDARQQLGQPPTREGRHAERVARCPGRALPRRHQVGLAHDDDRWHLACTDLVQHLLRHPHLVPPCR